MTKLDERPEVTIDFELMFGEMPAIPCESPYHGKDSRHAGDGAHYWRVDHECWIPDGTVYVVCDKRTQDMLKTMKERYTDRPWVKYINCQTCGNRTTVEKFISYIGPIGLTGK